MARKQSSGFLETLFKTVLGVGTTVHYKTDWLGRRQKVVRHHDSGTTKTFTHAAGFLFGDHVTAITRGSCFACNGTGEKSLDCRVCDGSGIVHLPARQCFSCDGIGKLRGRDCPKCQGTGIFKPACDAACRRCEGVGIFTVTCKRCEGSGRYYSKTRC